MLTFPAGEKIEDARVTCPIKRRAEIRNTLCETHPHNPVRLIIFSIGKALKNFSQHCRRRGNDWDPDAKEGEPRLKYEFLK
jgi:hypothetical protein